jgi:hypothetical protein
VAVGNYDQNQQTPLLQPQTPLPLNPIPRLKLDLKPFPPPNFDGNRHKGKWFINVCQAYFHLRPDQFPDEQTKIQWAMTYMNQGRAQNGANRIEGTSLWLSLYFCETTVFEVISPLVRRLLVDEPGLLVLP